MVSLTCAVYYPCDDISIKWYKSRTEMNTSDNVTRGNGEYINSSADGKYLQINPTTGGTTNNSNFEGCCFANSLLLILYFNQNDNDNYWCQIMTNSHPLEPSPYAYISLSSAVSIGERCSCVVSDLIRHLSPVQCAEYVTSTPLSRMTCNYQSTTTIAEYPQTNLVTVKEAIPKFSNNDSTLGENKATVSTMVNTADPVTVRFSLVTTVFTSGNNMGDSNSQLYATIGTLLLIIVILFLLVFLLVCLHIICYRIRQKQGIYQNKNNNNNTG